jgi:hypothetical protein
VGGIELRLCRGHNVARELALCWDCRHRAALHNDSGCTHQSVERVFDRPRMCDCKRTKAETRERFRCDP